MDGFIEHLAFCGRAAPGNAVGFWAPLGVLLCERAGVLNLGIEGIMAAGAFTGWLVVRAPLYVGAGGGVLLGAVSGLVARR